MMVRIFLENGTRMRFLLGIDVGGTKIEAVLLDDSFQTYSRKRIPTEREKGADHIIQNISNLILDILTDHDISLPQLKGIGLGLPGSVDPKTKLMINGNTTCLIDVPLTNILAKKISFPEERIKTANDANCFALAEANLGVGKNFSESAVSIGLILGTGCGSGITINRKSFTGSRGGAGEIGHTTLYPDGLPCYCGRKGCAELYLSGKGLENLYFEKTKSRKLATEILEIPEERKAYQKDLSTFLTNITNFFDPDYIVFGGGLSKDESLYKEVFHSLQESQFLKGSNPPKLLKNHLGDSAGVFGAAMLVI